MVHLVIRLIFDLVAIAASIALHCISRCDPVRLVGCVCHHTINARVASLQWRPMHKAHYCYIYGHMYALRYQREWQRS